MFTYSKNILNSGLTRNLTKHPITLNWNYIPRLFSSSLTYSRTDVKILIPLTGGHIAGQLWQGKENPGAPVPTPIVCMHGVQDNSCSFDPLIPLIIKDNMTILALDQLGHGFSSHTNAAGYELILDGVAIIHRAMRHYKWDKITLLGHSLGSILSFIFSGTNPGLVEKYIGIDNIHPVPRNTVFGVSRIYKALFDIEEKLINPNKPQPSYTYEDLLQRVTKARKGTVTEEGIKTLLKRGAIPDPVKPGFYKFSHDLKTNIPSLLPRFSVQQSMEIVSEIKIPTCIIKGDPGEDYEPRENYMKVVDALKTSTGGKLEFHLVPGTHHLHLNEPQCVAPIISDFLNKTF